MQLILEHVGKVYTDRSGNKTTALEDISLRVEKEEFIAIVGPSGCGKSTLLSMIAGLSSPSSGTIYFTQVQQPKIGVVFQEHALLPWRTVLRNVEFGLEQMGIPKKERSLRALELIKTVGLEGFEQRYPHQLSGGMRQRVGIARALAIEPDILLMDEPLSALDAQTRLLMQEEMIRLRQSYCQKTLYVTHNIQEAVALADKVVVLSRRPGKIVKIINLNIPQADRGKIEIQTEIANFADEIWQIIREDAQQALLEEESFN